MASTKTYLQFVLDQLAGLEGLTHRAMMGEYILYYREKIVGGIYDDRLLVKITSSSETLLPSAPREAPYEGAKAMLLVEDVENRELLERLLREMYDELPLPKPRKKKNTTKKREDTP